MLWALFLILVFIVGCIIVSVVFPRIDGLVKVVGSFIFGSLFSVSTLYFSTSYLFHSMSYSLYMLFFLSLIALFIFRKYRNIFSYSFSINELLFLTISVSFSFYIFSKSFGYDVKTSEFLIASNTYLDFGVHIPFIRSFSLGDNFPAQIPYFSHSNVLYHFMFDLYAGILEFLGLRIDIAFNLISSLAFAFLLILIYKISSLLYNQKITGALSVLFFLFSSNLSFLNFFTMNGFNFYSFWHNMFYREKGPLGNETISVFWTLNVYLNQRHLIFGILFVLFVLYTLLFFGKRGHVLTTLQIILLSISISLLPFWHKPMFIALYILLLGLGLYMKNLRKQTLLIIVISLIAAFPWIISSISEVSSIKFNPGFLISNRLTMQNVLTYWLCNLGIALFTVPLGFFIPNIKNRTLFSVFYLLFLIPNLFQLSPYMYDNHKFFNLWIILVNPFSAILIVYLFQKNLLFKTIGLIVFFLLVISGILNFMVIKNDVLTRIKDYPKQPLMISMLQKIPNNAIVASNGEIYDPLSLVGKKTYLGRSYYIYTYGGNPYEREKKLLNFLSSTNLLSARTFLKHNDISYVVLYKKDFAKNIRYFNESFFRKYFTILYEDGNGFIIKI